MQVSELSWCEDVAWLQPAGACGHSVLCYWQRCACRTRPSAAQCALKRGWPAAVCQTAAKKQCASLAVDAAPPALFLKGCTVVCTHPDVAQASDATHHGGWRGRCTCWCTARASAWTRGRWRRTQVRANRSECASFQPVPFRLMGAKLLRKCPITTYQSQLTSPYSCFFAHLALPDLGSGSEKVLCVHPNLS